MVSGHPKLTVCQIGWGLPTGAFGDTLGDTLAYNPNVPPRVSVPGFRWEPRSVGRPRPGSRGGHGTMEG